MQFMIWIMILFVCFIPFLMLPQTQFWLSSVAERLQEIAEELEAENQRLENKYRYMQDEQNSKLAELAERVAFIESKIGEGLEVSADVKKWLRRSKKALRKQGFKR